MGHRGAGGGETQGDEGRARRCGPFNHAAGFPRVWGSAGGRVHLRAPRRGVADDSARSGSGTAAARCNSASTAAYAASGVPSACHRPHAATPCLFFQNHPQKLGTVCRSGYSTKSVDSRGDSSWNRAPGAAAVGMRDFSAVRREAVPGGRGTSAISFGRSPGHSMVETVPGTTRPACGGPRSSAIRQGVRRTPSPSSTHRRSGTR